MQYWLVTGVVNLSLNQYSEFDPPSFQWTTRAIVIPETIDAIRALGGREPPGLRSIAATDAALGIGGDVFALPRL